MNEELKTCPFCFGEAKLVNSHEAVDNCSLMSKFIQCTVCDAKSKTFCVYNNKLEDLERLCIYAWNNRSARNKENYFTDLKESIEKETQIEKQVEYLKDEIKKLNSEISTIKNSISVNQIGVWNVYAEFVKIRDLIDTDSIRKKLKIMEDFEKKMNLIKKTICDYYDHI